MASLSTEPSRITPQCPWLVYSQQQRSEISSRSGWRCRIRRSACWTMPFSAKFSDPTSSLLAGIPKSSTARIPRDRIRSISSIQHLVHREMIDAGHGADLALDPGAMHHEQRLNQIGRGQLVLAHQLAYGARPAAAPGSIGGRKGHEGKTRERPPGPQPRSNVARSLWHMLCLL